MYRLFALSNFASLLALVAYPVLLEPWVTTAQQSCGWSAGYVLFVALCAGSAIYSARARTAGCRRRRDGSRDAGRRAPARASRDYALWLLLSAMGSFMLLAVTNHITHDVASVPFLWILPLTLYLLTFILCFEGRGWYQRALLPRAAARRRGRHGVGAAHRARHRGHQGGGARSFRAGLFVCCMFFHGELAAMKPRAALSHDAST